MRHGHCIKSAATSQSSSIATTAPRNSLRKAGAVRPAIGRSHPCMSPKYIPQTSLALFSCYRAYLVRPCRVWKSISASCMSRSASPGPALPAHCEFHYQGPSPCAEQWSRRSGPPAVPWLLSHKSGGTGSGGRVRSCGAALFLVAWCCCAS